MHNLTFSQQFKDIAGQGAVVRQTVNFQLCARELLVFFFLPFHLCDGPCSSL